MKKIISAVLSVVILLSLTACGQTASKSKYNSKTAAASIASDVVAENSDFRLLWNDDKKFVALESVKNGKIWSAVPYDYYTEGGSSASVNSSINITVNNADTMMTETLKGYTEVNEGGRIFSKRIDDGVRVVYCFDAYEISVTVDYTLEDDHLKATVDPKRVVEGGDFQLVSVSLAPFLCSADNSSEDSYLFVPTGSGALMYTDVRAEGTRSYSGEVYGDDAARIMPEDVTDEEQIYMPVFGAKNGTSSILGIIDSDAESAVIEAEAGNAKTGYSNVYPTFYFRGYDVYPTTLWVFNRQDIKQASSVMSTQKAVVNYYPLFDEDSDYIGMAERYRTYLCETKDLSDASDGGELYHLDIIGGELVDSAAWGIPHKKLSVLTTFSETEKILDDLLNETGIAPVVSLSGFSSTGLSYGKIAGGYKLDSDFGKISELLSYCNSEKIPVFVNYELLRFSKSGGGFSYLTDSARSASLHIAELYNINLPLRDYDKDTAYRFLSRSNLISAAEKLISAAKKQGIENISLASLGEVAYSDFGDSTYAVKGNMGKDVGNVLDLLSNAGMQSSVNGANVYAAVKADRIFAVPTDNGSYYAFDVSVPFYQLVFSGRKNLYSESVNDADNVNRVIMQAVSTGVHLSFTAAYDCDITTSVSSAKRIYGTKWDDINETVCKAVNSYSEYYAKISGARITQYLFLDGNITKTVFDNGVVVYANHSSTDVMSEVGLLSGYGVHIVSEQ